MDPLLLLEDVLVMRGPDFGVLVRHFAIAPGQRIAIVGRSGSGKSTCLDLMAGVLGPASAGRFAFQAPGQGAVDMAALWRQRDQSALRRLRARHLGYVLQTGGLVPFLTVGANVALPLRLGRAGEPDRAAALIAGLGLAGLEQRKPRQVSIGQRQRVAVARALASRPALILADEPTSSLDPETAESVMALLAEAAAREGAALIVVTHDRELAERHGLEVTVCGPGESSDRSLLDDRVAT